MTARKFGSKMGNSYYIKKYVCISKEIDCLYYFFSFVLSNP